MRLLLSCHKKESDTTIGALVYRSCVATFISNADCVKRHLEQQRVMCESGRPVDFSLVSVSRGR